MDISGLSTSGLASLVVVLDSHPLGGILLLGLVVAIVVGLAIYSKTPGKRASGDRLQ
jgi:hypothetical protein